jgi:prepilin-type processing-associated H-X9-DG protein
MPGGTVTPTPTEGQNDHLIRAQKMSTRATLTQLGATLRQYWVENGGWPEDLAALVAEDMVPAEALVARFDKAPLTVGDSRTSFQYVGTPLPADLPADAVLAYTRQGLLPGGRMVLFADGSVEWAPEGSLTEVREGSPERSAVCENVMRALGPNLTPEREAELREFYQVPEDTATDVE